jgi:hypothetical protein
MCSNCPQWLNVPSTFVHDKLDRPYCNLSQQCDKVVRTKATGSGVKEEATKEGKLQLKLAEPVLLTCETCNISLVTSVLIAIPTNFRSALSTLQVSVQSNRKAM